MHDTIARGVERRLQGEPGVHSVRVKVVWDPPWNPGKMSSEANKQLGYFNPE